jgi:hypothetical protein
MADDTQPKPDHLAAKSILLAFLLALLAAQTAVIILSYHMLPVASASVPLDLHSTNQIRLVASACGVRLLDTAERMDGGWSRKGNPDGFCWGRQ